MPWYWPWNAQQTPSQPPADAADVSLNGQLGELAASISQLTADLSNLRLEWAEVLDKINRWASRQAARERRRVHSQLDELDGGHGDGPEIAEDAPGSANGHHPAPSSPADRLAAKAALRAKIRR